MTIFAVVPVHNRVNLTLQFLDSLDAQDVDEEVHVLIIDDGSTDGTTKKIQQRVGRFPVTVIPGNGKLWWAGSVGKALKAIKWNVTQADWIYLGNNDTVLDPNHISYLLDTATSAPRTLVGARAFEMWPDGTEHPVSSGFMINRKMLEISAIPGNDDHIHQVDALSARGLLIPATALDSINIHPWLTPQHFADVSITSQLRKLGFTLKADHRAVSTQTDRAGSALELGATNRPSFDRKAPLFIPALVTFWWRQSNMKQKFTLPIEMLRK